MAPSESVAAQITEQPACCLDRYATERGITINGISGGTVLFADTILYPEGAGQPSEHGQHETTNKTVSIIDTKRAKDTGEARHEVDDIAGFQIGSSLSSYADE